MQYVCANIVPNLAVISKNWYELAEHDFGMIC